MKLPIFPLPIFLLPQGITRLRIFEQRYLNMIRDINKTQGFVIRYNSSQTGFIKPDWGSLVNIVDFDHGDDGVLTIDVKCEALVELTNYHHNSEQLLFADAQIKRHWSQELAQDKDQNQSEHLDNELSQQLEYFFRKNDAFNYLYQEKFFQDEIWVCCRWLELLPVTFQNKQLFVENNTFTLATKFIESILANYSE